MGEDRRKEEGMEDREGEEEEWGRDQERKGGCEGRLGANVRQEGREADVGARNEGKESEREVAEGVGEGREKG